MKDCIFILVMLACSINFTFSEKTYQLCVSYSVYTDVCCMYVFKAVLLISRDRFIYCTIIVTVFSVNDYFHTRTGFV